MTEMNKFCKFGFRVHIERATLEDHAFQSGQYKRWDRHNSPSMGRQPTPLIYGGLLSISTEQR